MTHRHEDYDFHSPLTREVGGISTCSFGSTFLPPKIHDIANPLPRPLGYRTRCLPSPATAALVHGKGRTLNRGVTNLSGRNRPGIFAFEFLLMIFAFEFFDFDQWILTSQKEMADLGAVLAVHLTFRLTHHAPERPRLSRIAFFWPGWFLASES